MTPIPFGKPILEEEERGAAAEVLAGTTLTHGPKVKEFEQAFAAFTGAPHAVATSTCMASLHLAYLYLDIGPGDEVLVPAQTHVAMAHAVEACGGRPVFVDADPRTGNVDLDLLEGLVTERTRAISVVHYLGLPVDMRRVVAFAREHDLFVVEDCAIALGARIGDTHVGLLGDVGCFSFYPVKHITTGEGGMIITTRDDVAERTSKQRAFGIDKSVLADRRHTGAYEIEHLGFNYRLGEVGAAIGVHQMRRLPGFLESRERNYRELATRMAAIDGVTVLASGHDGDLRSSHYCLVAMLEPELAERREAIIEALKERGVGSSVYYPRSLPDTRYYGEIYGHEPGSCPVATRISSDSIALPVGPHLADGDIERMTDALDAVLQEVPAHA